VEEARERNLEADIKPQMRRVQEFYAEEARKREVNLVVSSSVFPLI
jgi:hypothetical protein